MANFSGGEQEKDINKTSEIRFTCVSVNETWINYIGIIQKMAYFNATSN
jgi:hypothetical protein